MSEKPVQKKEVAIDSVLKKIHIIYFYASTDAANDMWEFGDVRPGGRRDFYQLVVDGRYEFSDVVAYMENYGQ